MYTANIFISKAIRTTREMITKRISGQQKQPGSFIPIYNDIPSTVMSPNNVRPLTLRTSPSDYATFNQIKSFLIFRIRLLLEREKQQIVFILSFHC